MNFRYATLIIIAISLGGCASVLANCEMEEYRMFDSLLGEWEEYELSDGGREHLGTLTTELVAGGCALKQTFISPDRSFSFESLGYLDGSKVWIEHYVLSIGKMSSYNWTKKGDTLVLDRILMDSGPMKRLVIFDISSNSYFVADEVSNDNGNTWIRRELVQTIRRSSADQ